MSSVPNSQTTPLLPCPFCNAVADYRGEIQGYQIECTECGVRGHSYSTAENAMEVWNRRHQRSGPDRDAWPDQDQEPCATMAQCHAHANACIKQGREEFIGAVNELRGVYCFPDDLELFWERMKPSSPHATPEGGK